MKKDFTIKLIGCAVILMMSLSGIQAQAPVADGNARTQVADENLNSVLMLQ